MQNATFPARHCELLDGAVLKKISEFDNIKNYVKTYQQDIF
jgi:hypothetical protein